MSTPDPYDALSQDAFEIVDQLVDIAHDEPDATPGIEWYTPDEEVPMSALEELAAAGICRHYRENDSVMVELTDAGHERYV